MKRETFNMMLVGVGGGGCCFSSVAVGSFGANLPAVGFDSDALAARSISNMRCMILGAQRYDGHSTGGDGVKGRTAVSDDLDAVTAALSGVRLAVVVTALGGGFGNGATPAILKILRDNGAHTLCFATLPFAFEGKQRCDQARQIASHLEAESDALVVLPMDNLYGIAPAGATLADAIPQAEAAFGAALTLFWRLLQTRGFITLNEEHLIAALAQSKGRCRFAVATADGASRSAEAVVRLCRSPLLGSDPRLGEVQAVMVGILAGSDLQLVEANEISQRLKATFASGCELQLGVVLDERYAGKIQLVAILFDVLRARGAERMLAAGTEGGSELLSPAVEKAEDSRVRRSRERGPRTPSRSRFKDVEATLIDGQDLDQPAYLRRGMILDR